MSAVTLHLRLLQPQQGRRPSLGFTMVELLVVVGIIAVLISILVPVVMTVRNLAKRTSCQSNLRQIYAVMLAYAADNQGQLFPHTESLSAPPRTGPYYYVVGSPDYIPMGQRNCQPQCGSTDTVPTTEGWAWMYLGGGPPNSQPGFYPLLYPKYVQDGRIFDCPGNLTADAAPANFAFQFDFTNVENAISSGNPWIYFSSYVGNIYGRLGIPANQRGGGVYSAYYIGGYYPNGPHALDQESPQGALMWDVGSYLFTMGYTSGTCPTYGCHRIGGNYLFTDGSVKWITYSWVQ